MTVASRRERVLEPGAFTPEGSELIRRLRCALAEVGYADVCLREESPLYLTGTPFISTPAGVVPHPVLYRALELTRRGDVACWSCWEASGHRHAVEPARSCVLGSCRHPDAPSRPPRR